MNPKARPAPTRTQRRGELRRRQLIEAARELLVEREIDGISLEDIARRADIPVASAYHFYPTKLAVFAATATQLGSEIAAELRRPLPAARIRRWEDVLTMSIDRAVRYYARNPATGRLLIDPKSPAEIKLADRMNDRSLGILLEEMIGRHFVLPAIRDRARVFFHAVEIVDLMFLLSMIQEGRITRDMVAHARIAGIAYLREFLPRTLPRRNSSRARKLTDDSTTAKPKPLYRARR